MKVFEFTTLDELIAFIAKHDRTAVVVSWGEDIQNGKRLIRLELENCDQMAREAQELGLYADDPETYYKKIIKEPGIQEIMKRLAEL